MFKNRKPFVSHDDISGTGNRIGINEKAFLKGRSAASNDLSFIDEGSSLSSKELEHLIEF